MNKICVYAIAKNESKFVKQWVDSMSKADHIIVLDTGSTDNTVNLLRSLGVEVHEKKYDHFRFDTARNDSLDLVPEEYNIRVCTDLDEKFEQDNWADILKQEWDEEAGRVIYHYVWNHGKEGENGLEFDINKIHGRDPDLRWAGAVHEHLTFMSNGKRSFSKYVDLRDKITLHHYPDFKKDRKFYIDLAEERLIENPDDWQAYVLLGNEYRVKDNPEKSIEKYLYVIQNFRNICSTTDLAGVYFALGDAYYRIKDAVKAMTAFSNGIAVDIKYRDNYYGLAILYYENGMTEAALGILKEALKTTQRAYSWMEDPCTWTYGLYDLLGCVYFSMGKKEKAISNSLKALKYDPDNKILQEKYNTYLSALLDN